jgi:hypothetical protein
MTYYLLLGRLWVDGQYTFITHYVDEDEARFAAYEDQVYYDGGIEVIPFPSCDRLQIHGHVLDLNSQLRASKRAKLARMEGLA